MSRTLQKKYLYLAIIIILPLVVFSETIGFEFLQYDDPAFVTENPYVSSGITADSIQWSLTYQTPLGAPPLKHPGVTNLWHPLTWISYMADVEIWGKGNSFGPHLSNLLLHLASGVVVFLFFRILFKSCFVGLITALLFAVHPLHVESVAWVSERKDVLSGLFFFLSLLFYTVAHQRANIYYQWVIGASVFAFTLALMAKPSVIILPALLLLIDYQQGRFPKCDSIHPFRSWFTLIRRELIQKLPWIIPAIAIALITIRLQTGGSHGYWIAQSSLIDRLGSSFVAFWHYFIKTLAPLNLSFHYPFPSWASRTTLMTASTLATGALLVLLFKNRKKFSHYYFALLWFLICMLPMSGLVYVGSDFANDRYSYLSLCGFFAAIAISLKKRPPYLSSSIAITVVAILSLLTFQQTKAWRSSETLFQHAIASQPDDYVGYTNLAGLRQNHQQFTEAIAYYKKSIHLFPYDHIAYYNLGNCYASTHRLEDAIESYHHALRIYPDYLPALQNAAMLLLQTKNSFYDPHLAETLAQHAFDLSHRQNPTIGNILLKSLIKNQKRSEAYKLHQHLQSLPHK